MLEMIIAVKVVVTSAKHLSLAGFHPAQGVGIPFRLLFRYRPSISETTMAMF